MLWFVKAVAFLIAVLIWSALGLALIWLICWLYTCITDRRDRDDKKKP